MSVALLACSAGSDSKGNGGNSGGAGSGPSTGGSGVVLTGGTGSTNPSGGTTTLGGSDSSGGSGGGTGCQTTSVTFEPKTPTVLLMVDRSSTMFQNKQQPLPQGANGDPWDTLRDGVLQVVQELSADVRFGILSVTGTQAECPMLDEVAPAQANFDAVNALYTDLKEVTTPKGESPGMLGLGRAEEILTSDTTPGEKYILFVTDGEQDYCGDGNPICPVDSMIWHLQTLSTKGIKTFIFGLPLSGTGVTQQQQAAYEMTLGAFANAGAGEPVAAPYPITSIYDQCFPGGDPNSAGWKAEFTAAGKMPAPTTRDQVLGTYSAASGTATVFKPDPTDQEALAAEFRKVLAGVKSCSFDLGGQIKVDLTQLDAAKVLVQGAEVPLDDANGWKMTSPTTLELSGAACDNWRMPQNTTIDFDFPCEILVPE